MKNILIIGDIHGKIDEYKKILQNENYDYSITLGDIGFEKEYKEIEKFINPKIDKILFGNHDYYPYLNKSYSLKNSSNFLSKIFCIRGAYSIDQYRRTIGFDYFTNEELSYSQMNKIYDKYREIKPAIVISHDCPNFIINEVKYDKSKSNKFDIKPSSTSKFLEELFKIHKPKFWFFGHHHVSKNIESVDIDTQKETFFKCFKELETKILTIK